MDANEYQRLAGRTLIDEPRFWLTELGDDIARRAVRSCAINGLNADTDKKGVFHRVWPNSTSSDPGAAVIPHMTTAEMFAAWNVLGLCGEAGEVAALVDQSIASRQPINADALRKELGDVLWYVAALATKHGLTLAEIMQANIDKLKVRYPEGYSDAASAARVDERVTCAGCGHECERAYADTCDHGCGRLICADCWAHGEVICAECWKDEEAETC